MFLSLQNSVHTEALPGSRKSRSHQAAVRKQEAWKGFTCLLTGQGRVIIEFLFSSADITRIGFCKSPDIPEDTDNSLES